VLTAVKGSTIQLCGRIGNPRLYMRKKMGKKNIYAQSDAALDEVSA
jgi:hypothetical protein